MTEKLLLTLPNNSFHSEIKILCYVYLLIGWMKLSNNVLYYGCYVWTGWIWKYAAIKSILKSFVIKLLRIFYDKLNNKCRYDLCLKQNLLLCIFGSWEFCVSETDI